MINEYNEISYAIKILESGFLTKKLSYELSILSKYFYYKGLKQNEVKSEVVEFCKKHIEEFNENKYYDKINSIVNSSKKKPIVELGAIKIYNSDIEYIDSFNEDKKFNEVLFSIIIIKRIRELLNQKKYLNISYSKLSKMSGLNKTDEIYPIINKMMQLNILKICRNSNCEILINQNKAWDEIFEVNDIDNCYGYYRNYNKCGKYIECSCCGKIVKAIKKSRIKYCKQCSKEIERKNSTERVRKYRENLKCNDL